MAKVLFSYDLNKQGQDYNALIAKIKAVFPNYWHCLGSTWIVETSMTPVQVRDWLSTTMDSNDELFVVDITGRNAAWAGFDANCNSWLQSNL